MRERARVRVDVRYRPGEVRIVELCDIHDDAR